MQQTITATVAQVTSAQAALESTVNTAATLVSATFRDRSALERLAGEIQEAKARAASMREEALGLFIDAADFFGGFEQEITIVPPTLLTVASQPAAEEVVAVAALPAQETAPEVPLAEVASGPLTQAQAKRLNKAELVAMLAQCGGSTPDESVTKAQLIDALISAGLVEKA